MIVTIWLVGFIITMSIGINHNKDEFRKVWHNNVIEKFISLFLLVLLVFVAWPILLYIFIRCKLP
jgi:uncharacterized BrkB/YihY/UPF0761 family membrane protein